MASAIGYSASSPLTAREPGQAFHSRRTDRSLTCQCGIPGCSRHLRSMTHQEGRRIFVQEMVLPCVGPAWLSNGGRGVPARRVHACDAGHGPPSMA